MNSLSVRGTLGAHSAKAIPHRASFPLPDLTYVDRDLILIQKNVIARATERVKIETISRAPGRTLRSQIRQASLLGLTYNLYRLRHPDLYKDVNRAS